MRFLQFAPRDLPGVAEAPPPPPRGPEDATLVEETVEPVPPPPGRRVIVDEAPPGRNIWPWLLAALFAAAAIVFFVLWLTQRESGPATRNVPNLIGLREPEARSVAQARGFDVETVRRAGLRPAGTVAEQGPEPGVRLQKGAQIILVVSSGRAQVSVPDATGLKLEAARRVLTTAGFTTKTRIVESEKPAGTVLAQDPAAGQKAAKSAEVLLSVSKGPSQVAVPDVQGQTVEQATKALADLGLVTRVIRVASSEPEGTVIAQDPQAAQKVKPGSAVRLNVSLGPQSTTVVSTETRTVETTTTTP
jgi:beta-lactam-binding protein with PASTA domain